jgi:hypothetical protein
MGLKDKAEALALQLTSGASASAFFGIFQGRCTFFATCFTIVGIYGWLHGRDLTSYALFVTSIQGLLVLHSWKEDVMEQRQVSQQSDKKV